MLNSSIGSLARCEANPYISARTHPSSVAETSTMDSADDDVAEFLSSVRRDVERGIEGYVLAVIDGGYFNMLSAVGSIDAGRAASARQKVKRERRIVRNDKGDELHFTIPMRNAIEVVRTRRRGGFPIAATETDSSIWLSDVNRKLGRLTREERHALVGAALLKVVGRSEDDELRRIDAALGSSTLRKQMGHHGEAEQRRRAVFLRRHVATLARRRKSLVHRQIYANAWTMFAIVCGRDLAYCLRMSEN